MVLFSFFWIPSSSKKSWYKLAKIRHYGEATWSRQPRLPVTVVNCITKARRVNDGEQKMDPSFLYENFWLLHLPPQKIALKQSKLFNSKIHPQVHRLNDKWNRQNWKPNHSHTPLHHRPRWPFNVFVYLCRKDGQIKNVESQAACEHIRKVSGLLWSAGWGATRDGHMNCNLISTFVQDQVSQEAFTHAVWVMIEGNWSQVDQVFGT